MFSQLPKLQYRPKKFPYSSTGMHAQWTAQVTKKELQLINDVKAHLGIQSNNEFLGILFELFNKYYDADTIQFGEDLEQEEMQKALKLYKTLEKYFQNK